jgi:hypothetical protein
VSTIEVVTIIISSVAIGAAIASLLTFVLFGAMQRRLIVRDNDQLKVPQETAAVLGLLGNSFRDDVLDHDREVVKALVQRYSETSLTSVFADTTERAYLFEALADPSRLPWKSEEQQRVGGPNEGFLGLGDTERR